MQDFLKNVSKDPALNKQFCGLTYAQACFNSIKVFINSIKSVLIKAKLRYRIKTIEEIKAYVKQPIYEIILG